jgi:hypothetical protein
MFWQSPRDERADNSRLPAIEPVATSAFAASKRGSNQPEESKDHRGDPQDVERESCPSED